MKILPKLLILSSLVSWQAMAITNHSLETFDPIKVDFQECFQGQISRLQYNGGFNVGSLFINTYWNSMGGGLLNKCERFNQIKNHIHHLNEEYLNPQNFPTHQYVCRLEGQIRGAVAKAWELSEICQEKAVTDAVDDGVRTGVANADRFCSPIVAQGVIVWEPGPVKGKVRVEIPEFPNVVDTYLQFQGMTCKETFIARTNENCPTLVEEESENYQAYLGNCDLEGL